jgi:Tfp pilus assembly protein PilZ
MAISMMREAPTSLGEAKFHDRRPVASSLDRRAVPRFSVEIDVDVHTSHNFYEGLVRDMGVAGVFIATHHDHAAGELIELRIQLPDGGEPISAIGEVRWMRVYCETNDTEPGIGLMFKSISDADRDRIVHFLRYREPLLYDD